MESLPKITKLSETSAIWDADFGSFSATVYVPTPKPELKSELLNYGFISPYLLVFAPEKFNYDQAVAFAREKGLEKIAGDFASSVVFIFPASGSWKTADKNIFANIISNSRIHQYFVDGVVKAWNRFTNNIDGYYIRGAIFRTNLYGFGDSADYIAKNCLKHFEGDGLWGKSDIAPVTCTLCGLSETPDFDAEDIPVISYNNSKETNLVFEKVCSYFLDKSECKLETEFEKDFYGFSKKFRRMTGDLIIDTDLLEDGLIREPGIATLKTSSDNKGDDKDTNEHKVGYFAFYNEGILDKGPLPLVLGFHGGGDSCFFLSIMAGWARICHRHNFLLVTVENHLNSTATEMQELIEQLKQKYPIDATRIYASGFSMGGIKTWDFIQEYPNTLAAAAPMDATVDIGENVYFAKTDKPVNYEVAVPTFYAAGEITPLAEMPCQEQKCINRMEYILKLNGAAASKKYTKDNIKLEEKDTWENKFWGINGDFEIKKFDLSRDATLTMQLFKTSKNKIYNVFASISGQGHDCREHTCEHAWQFMSQFSRSPKGKLNGGNKKDIIEVLKK